MEKLPKEILQYILDLLPVIDLMSSSQVNRKWNNLVKNAPEYDFIFTPKVIKLRIINCYKRRTETLYICDSCINGDDRYGHKQCVKCDRLYCLNQYPYTNRNEVHCLKCLHELGKTCCNKTWKECRLKLRTSLPVCFDCFDKGCDSCHKKSLLYYNMANEKLCG